MHNSDTAIGENVRYIFNRIDNQTKNTTQLSGIILAGAIRELCEARDIVQFVDHNQICNMIDMLCTR